MAIVEVLPSNMDDFHRMMDPNNPLGLIKTQEKPKHSGTDLAYIGSSKIIVLDSEADIADHDNDTCTINKIDDKDTTSPDDKSGNIGNKYKSNHCDGSNKHVLINKSDHCDINNNHVNIAINDSDSNSNDNNNSSNEDGRHVSDTSIIKMDVTLDGATECGPVDDTFVGADIIREASESLVSDVVEAKQLNGTSFGGNLAFLIEAAGLKPFPSHNEEVDSPRLPPPSAPPHLSPSLEHRELPPIEPPIAYCMICISPTEFYESDTCPSCNFLICGQCLLQSAEVTLNQSENRLSCVNRPINASGCPRTYTVADLQAHESLLSTSTLVSGRYRKMLDRIARDEESCPECQSSHIAHDEDFDLLYCSDCNYQFTCTKKEDVDAKAPETKSKRIRNSIWKMKNTKKCPLCQSRIQKNGGCSHMKCQKCNCDFCWTHVEVYPCKTCKSRSVWYIIRDVTIIPFYVIYLGGRFIGRGTIKIGKMPYKAIKRRHQYKLAKRCVVEDRHKYNVSTNRCTRCNHIQCIDHVFVYRGEDQPDSCYFCLQLPSLVV